MAIKTYPALGIVVSLLTCGLLAWNALSGFSTALARRSPELSLALLPANEPALALIALREKKMAIDGDSVKISAGSNSLADAASASAAPAPGGLSSPDLSLRKSSLPEFFYDPKTMLRLGKAALRSEPLNADSLKTIAIAYAKLGKNDEARRLMETVVRRTLHDRLSRAWLLNESLEREDISQAMQHFDFVFRLFPEMQTNILTALAAVADHPSGRKVVLARLREKPDWLSQFLVAYPRASRSKTALTEFYTSLEGGLRDLDTAVLRALVNGLLAQDNVEAAYYVWLQSLPEMDLKNLPFIYNGDFEKQTTNIPFDWYIREQAGARTEVVSVERESKQSRVLEASFFGQRVMYSAVQQWLMLVPGNYSLHGKVNIKNINSQRGLVWRLICISRERTRLGETERMRGTQPGWKNFELRFEVPRANCPAQVLLLATAARNAPESMITGSIQFDDLLIRKEE